MPSLIIMRHAKAVDRMEAEDDFDRGLTPRGPVRCQTRGRCHGGPQGLKPIPL